jgi:hypothetical protein
MNPKEIRTRLERELHTTIKAAEWAYLEDVGLVHELEVGMSAWPEFRSGAEDNLRRARTLLDNYLREQAGEDEVESRETGKHRQQNNVPEVLDVPGVLDERTAARLSALTALNNLRSDSYAPSRSMVLSAVLPRGGVDGTVPQWLCVIAAELWMPAEAIAGAFRRAQQNHMIEPDQPRTQARAFRVARFVWAMEAAHSKRPSWPEMCKRWNDAATTRPFKHWRDFKKYYVRGEKATLPQYKESDEQITAQVREATARGECVLFDSWASLILAGTVY